MLERRSWEEKVVQDVIWQQQKSVITRCTESYNWTNLSSPFLLNSMIWQSCHHLLGGIFPLTISGYNLAKNCYDQLQRNCHHQLHGIVRCFRRSPPSTSKEATWPPLPNHLPLSSPPSAFSPLLFPLPIFFPPFSSMLALSSANLGQLDRNLLKALGLHPEDSIQYVHNSHNDKS